MGTYTPGATGRVNLPAANVAPTFDGSSTYVKIDSATPGMPASGGVAFAAPFGFEASLTRRDTFT